MPGTDFPSLQRHSRTPPRLLHRRAATLAFYLLATTLSLLQPTLPCMFRTLTGLYCPVERLDSVGQRTYAASA